MGSVGFLMATFYSVQFQLNQITTNKSLSTTWYQVFRGLEQKIEKKESLSKNVLFI